LYTDHYPYQVNKTEVVSFGPLQWYNQEFHCNWTSQCVIRSYVFKAM